MYQCAPSKHIHLMEVKKPIASHSVQKVGRGWGNQEKKEKQAQDGAEEESGDNCSWLVALSLHVVKAGYMEKLGRSSQPRKRKEPGQNFMVCRPGRS